MKPRTETTAKARALLVAIVAAGLSAPWNTARADETGWTPCADDGGRCVFASTRYVRYGANDRYVTRLFTRAAACSSESFGGDPAPGVSKQCWYTDSTPTWNLCASEGGRCTFNGTLDVRYGQSSGYVYKTPTNAIDCTNQAFGPELLAGDSKACWYADAPVTWTRCASENARCTYSGAHRVRYGWDNHYLYLTAAGGVDCNNQTFQDPLAGVVKTCWYASDVSVAPLAATQGNTTTTLIPSTGAAAGFLTRNGSTLMLNGAPYKTVGFNVFGMAGCFNGGAWSDATLDAYFSALRPNSLTRSWAFLNYGTGALDRVVAAAERHQQMLILSLSDGAGFCADTDGRSAGEGTLKTAAWYSGGYRTNYLPWVKTVVARYRDSKAIGMWELINEPRADGVSNQIMRMFFDEAAATIHGIDSRHLIESGCLGEYAPGTTDYAYIHGGSNIDVASVHEYDYDWQDSRTIVSGHVDNVLSQMAALNKPVIVGEVGIDAGAGCWTSTAQRADAFVQKFDAYLRRGVAGVFVWNWLSPSRGGCNNDVTPDDPLVPAMKSYRVP